MISNDRTPLHLAVENKSDEIVQLLLLHKGININFKDQIYIYVYYISYDIINGLSLVYEEHLLNVQKLQK